MQNGALKSASVALSSRPPARAGDIWTKRLRATPDPEVSEWPKDTTQDDISKVQIYSPSFSSNTSGVKDPMNFAERPAAPVEISSPSPLSSSDTRCSASSFSENRKTAHTVCNDAVRGAGYVQGSIDFAGTEISDLKESLLASRNEMFSQSEPTVMEDISFPWSNSVEVLRNMDNSVGFHKQNLYIQHEVPTSSWMDRSTSDGKLGNGIDVAWSTILPYGSTVPLKINADNGFRVLREDTTENAGGTKLAGLLNASNDKVPLQVFSAASDSNGSVGRSLDQTTSKTISTPICDSCGKGKSPRLIKMDDISSSNSVIPSTVSHIAPSIPVTFQSSNILTVHTDMRKMDFLYSVRNKVATVQCQNSSRTANDFAFASSSSKNRIKSTSHEDNNEEPATEHIKRTCSVLENGDPPAIPSSHAFKKPRITPGSSTLSASLKVQVRKVKLGERITALQQLVSPFGKTDTASVLLEAIGYIKFLQEQVQVLSAPYLKAINPCPQIRERSEETKYDLRSRGLCLVPVSSTAHVTNDNGADFWTSGIGSSSRF